MSHSGHSVAILAHSQDGFWDEPRLVHLLMSQWEDMGLKVDLVTDVEDAAQADLAIQHVSLSVVPPAYQQLAARFPRTVNGLAVDIRKRRFSRLLVGREDSYGGAVIVKTDRNAGGWREHRVSPWWRRMAEAALPWRMRRFVRPEDYPVFPGSRLVPHGVWANRNLVVERFVPEREGEWYVCRHWLFLGSREVTRRTASSHPVVKFRGVMEPTSEPIPVELRAIREELGFDYGKFDYGIVDGEVVLYDVNRTPGAAPDAWLHAGTVDALAPGILDFFA
ncbi:MAG TPA: hypothetical protein VFH11_04605 [Gemmatimonadota bacterium]|nr:hypothetical protein [Gemmatimonadota bacterium]